MENKVLENYRVRFWISVIVLFAIGIIFLFLSELVDNENIWKDVLENIGTAFFFTGIFGLIQEYILKDKLVDVILSKLRLKEDIDRTGIEKVFFGISDIDYRYYFKKAVKNIDILHIYGRTWTNNHIDEIEERLLNSNCKIRIILLSPDSPFVPALAEFYGQTPDELKQTIDSVAKMWKESYLKKEVQKRKKNQSAIDLYYHCGFPTNSLYRIDDRVVFVQNKMTKGKTKSLPSFICKNTSREDLYSNYLTEINTLIKEAKKVDWNDI